MPDRARSVPASPAPRALQVRRAAPVVKSDDADKRIFLHEGPATEPVDSTVLAMRELAADVYASARVRAAPRRAAPRAPAALGD